VFLFKHSHTAPYNMAPNQNQRRCFNPRMAWPLR
jgi:hypothetical protein